MTNPSDQLLAQAESLSQGGRMRDAYEVYQQVLAVDAENFQALRAVGMMEIQRQQLQPGVALLRRAAQLQPNHASTHYELGRALYMQGDLHAAVRAFDAALAAAPDYAEAYNARGIMLSTLGQREEAGASFRKAIAINPQYAGAHNNLGNEQLMAKQFEEALSSFDRALAAQPNFANACNGRGNALLSLSRYDEALASFERAVVLEPKFAEAWSGHGNALAGLRRHDDALASYARALALDPSYFDVFENQGNTYLYLKRYQESLACYRRMLAIKPGNPQTLCNIGEALMQMGRHGEALKTFEEVLAARPDFETAHTGKARALLMLGRHREAIEGFEKIIALYPENPDLLQSLLFNLNYMDSIPASEVFAWHKQFGERYETPLMPAWRPHANAPDPDRALRVGFVSGDLRHHPVGYFMENVLANLPKTSLHLMAYANQIRDDEVSDRLRPHFEVWRNIRNLTDDEVANQIRADGIDILVDLSGHTKANRLLVFARKPAPVQVTYLGYFTSTGLKSIDYFLVDRWQAPEGEPLYYTETPYRLPGHHLCFTPPKLDIPVGPLPAGANGYVTFGNFNMLAKMNDAVVATWSEILKAVPGSRLFLKSEQLDGEDVAASVQRRFAALGIGGDRLTLEGKSPYDAYLASYHRVDIALDPYPYNGGTVTIQALWMGVPVLTLRGDCHVGRNGTSILSALEMPEWVAQNEAEYVARAAQLAGDLESLADLRGRLRDRLVTSPLCDAPRFAHDLEAAFRAMWQAWCSRKA